MANSIHDRNLSFDGIERLEARQLLAGNVTAVVNPAGDLIINGDNLDNRIDVSVTQQFDHATQSMTDVLLIRGQATSGNQQTLINGENSATISIPESGIRDVKINLKGGDDTAHVQLGGRNLKVVLGSGSDSFELQSRQFSGRAQVIAGSGDDTVVFRDSSASRATINTGGGNDQIDILGSDIGDRSLLVTGSGNDEVNLGLTDAPRLKVVMGAGNDILTLAHGDFSEVNVLMGAGSDTLNLPVGLEQSFYNTRFNGGPGNDINNGTQIALTSFDQGTDPYTANLPEQRTRTETYTVMVPEQRTRIETYVDANGVTQTREVTYTVFVPQTRVRTVTYTVLVPVTFSATTV